MSYINNLTKSQLAAELSFLFKPLQDQVAKLEAVIETMKKERTGQKNEFLSIREVQELMGVSRGTIYNYIKAGKLNPHNLSIGKVVFDSEEVIRFIKLTKK
jgi:excisionase family DNA binding protein